MSAPAPHLAPMDTPAVTRVYRRLAPFYDKTFGKVADAALKQTIARANDFSGSLLEVGVGTGLALPHYGPQLSVTGIDLSPDMLARARERVEKLRLPNIAALTQMDATAMSFADASFHVVVALYVMTVVPDPVAVIHEIARVVKPGGRVLICNHFSVEKGLRSRMERRLSNYADVLGFRSEFPQRTLMVSPHLKLERTRPLKPFGFFTLMDFTRAS